jgi:hypothetical protein
MTAQEMLGTPDCSSQQAAYRGAISLVVPDNACGPVDAAKVYTRHPNSWAAYGRFLYAAIRTRSAASITCSGDGLFFFRRRVKGFDPSLVYAFHESASAETDIWTTAEKAVQRLASRSRVDQLNLYVAGAIPQEDGAGSPLHPVLGGAYLGLALPCETRDILELRDSYEGFLQGLGHSNRRHMKAHFKEAVEGGFRLELSRDPQAPGMERRHDLAKKSRPIPFSCDLVQAFDDLAHAQPGFFHAALMGPEEEFMSYCSGFLERDSAVVLYQFNHPGYPRLALSMTLRAFLIQHWAGTEIKRILFPLGINGHLAHATTTNPIAQVFLVRRSVAGVAKAILGAIVTPTSDAAKMVQTTGFWQRAITG